jgi:4'-phosphopantetheinyl transferase EntD
VTRDLFPAAVRVASGAIEDGARLHPDEEPLAAAMGPARRREFAAGRDCARRAMRELGLPGGPVLRGARRAPLWPEGVVGAITHSDGFCAAAVARSSDLAGLGLDAEREAPLSERALARICSPREIDALRALSGQAPEHWGNVVFSAKESVYKAYFPLTGVFIGFRDAEIELHPDAEDAGRFDARLVRDDAPDAAGRRRFAGRFRSDGTRIVTGLVIERS